MKYLFALFFCIMLLPVAANAQMPYPGQTSYSFHFRDNLIRCYSNRMELVAFVAAYGLPDVGIARRSIQGPFVEYNPQIFLSLPPEIQLFWFGHECGHHALGHMDPYGGNFLNPNSENEADCYAGQFMARHGLTKYDIPAIWNNLNSLWPSYAGHAPGHVRAANMKRCFDMASGPAN